ncbi:hypothetical protein T484DRAFT_1756174 [Baffinella frigidus]|nr:hypothetical protein T484DRAFT_1756174 [Cryptophyta sp. CCMP2293]
MCSFGPCSCESVMGDANSKDVFLTCNICAEEVGVTVCNTFGEGFVCSDVKCRVLQDTLGEFPDESRLQIPPLAFYLNIASNEVTGALELHTGNDRHMPIPTPDQLVMMFLAQHGFLVLPDHQYAVEVYFETIGKVIYMEFAKPLQTFNYTDGTTKTRCDKWAIRCLPGSSLSMCEPIPLGEGQHRVTIECTRMKRL